MSKIEKLIAVRQHLEQRIAEAQGEVRASSIAKGLGREPA